MALDQALLESLAAGSPPVLRFFGWQPPAVSLGYFQGIEDEVDLRACARRGVDLVRRISGGGAVFHQEEVTYSLILPAAHPLAQGSLEDSYRRFCRGIILGLESLGLEAAFAPINDVVLCQGPWAGRKVSGNAQSRRQSCILHHGTVLLDLDPGLMFELLKPPPEKNRKTGGRRVAGLREVLNRRVDFEEACRALEEGFTRSLGLALSPGEPDPGEMARARQLVEEKFGCREWLFRR
jgi:lipoate-protein ligase A